VSPIARIFLLLGSGEFEPWSTDVERRALAGANGDGSVAILPTASAPEGDAVFDRWAAMGLAHYEEAGIPAHVVSLKTRADAMSDELVAAIEASSMIFFSGGKPQHLARVLHDSPVFAGVLRAIERGAAFAGCSAGAMVASRSRAHNDDEGGANFVFGLGLVEHVSFGVHWDKAKWIPGFRPLGGLVRRDRRAHGDPR
jgi:cyanophycinase-like exopeptidase